jgi:hypothetical protein
VRYTATIIKVPAKQVRPTNGSSARATASLPDFSWRANVKKIVAALVLGFPLCVAATPAFAQMKPCEELKSEIAAKLDAKGVKDSASRLAIVPAEEVKDQKVVGSCEAGKKKITYTVPGAAPSAPDQGGKPVGKPTGD